ncbi:MAG: AI-2E family transporter [Actinomycetes bacterium]|nr:AI-2E family transporter [Actinomycetes bacterium]
MSPTGPPDARDESVVERSGVTAPGDGSAAPEGSAQLAGSAPPHVVGSDPVHPEPLPLEDVGPGWSDPELRPAPAPPLVLHPVSFVYIVGGLLLAAAVIGLIESATAMLWSIAMGVVLALAMDPVVSAVRRRWGWSRPSAVLLVAGSVIAFLVAVMVLMGPQAVRQAEDLGADLPKTVEEFYDLPVVGDWLANRDMSGRVEEAIKELPAKVSDESVTTLVQNVIGGALTALILFAVTVAVLLDGEQLIATARRRLPSRWVGRADEVGRVFYIAIGHYFGGSLVVAVLMGIVVLMLCLVFGVPLAPLAAIWAMITDLIPQIGGFLGGAFLGLLALTQGPVTFVVVVTLFVLYMNLENHVISPAIVGQAVDVTPPTTMLAAFIGGAAGGVPGALIATPLVGAVKQLYMQLRWGRQPFAKDRPGVVARLRALLRRSHT